MRALASPSDAINQDGDPGAVDRREPASSTLDGCDAALLLAHDLMSPLSALIGNVAWAEKHTSGPIAAALRDSLAGARRLERMVEALVDAWSSERTPLVTRRGTVELTELAREVARSLMPPVAEQQIELTLPASQVFVHDADGDLLRRILENLLDNALRYSPPDAPVVLQIAAAPSPIDPNAPGACIFVCDRGPGMPVDARAQLFGPLPRDPSTIVNGRRSHGLGLWFTRLAVEAHGGCIRVLPSAERGCTFEVWLPERAPRPRPRLEA